MDGDVAPDVHRLPTQVPFPVPPANTTFVDGAVPTLFDTGTSTNEGWGDLKQHAEERGIELAELERIVLTHAHLDHAGNAKRLHDLSGAEVWIHEAEAQDLREWGQHAEARNASYGQGLARAGLPAHLLERLGRGNRSVDHMLHACEVSRELKDGDTFQAGDRTFEVHHTPGHTAGSSIYVADDASISITGDTVLERITPNALSVRKEEEGALGRYMATLRALRHARLGIMIPGHGLPFTDIEGTVARAERLFDRRHERILGFLADGEESTVWNVVTKEWPEGHEGAAFLMTSEILGHMDLLVADGRVKVREPDAEGDPAWYQLAK